MNPQPAPESPLWWGRTVGTIVECIAVDGLGTVRQYWVPDPAPAAPPVDPVVLARRAVAEMQLATPPLAMTPPPNLADPNIIITLPAHIWFSDTGPTALGPVTETATDAGLTVTATATLSTITLDYGDGTTQTCAAATVLSPPVNVMATPACGHAWTRTSTDQPGGTYTVTATTDWAITWTGGTQTGTLTHQTTATLAVAVTDHPVQLVTNP